MSGFPSRPEGMDADWLAQALGRPAGALAGFTAKAVGTGQMCDSFRLTLDWRDRGDAPASIIAKCPSLDPASRAIAQQLGSYLLEVSWYRDLAGEVPISVPRCSFADIAEDRIEFLLLLEDLAPATQGDQLAGASADAISACVTQASRLHAALWDSPRLTELDWLQKDNRPLLRAAFPGLYQAFRERYAGRLDAECLDVGARLVDRLEGYVDRTPQALCLTHGDMRVDNVLFGRPATPASPLPCWVVDWQTLGIGAGGSDIAYLVGTSIADADQRAALDRPMFDLWLDGLRAGGVTPDPAVLWDDYRIGALSGYFMAVFASMNVERTERGDEMFAVMAERPARQALALGSLDLL